MTEGQKRRKLFGTDGIRGVANSYPLIPEVVIGLGRAIAAVYKRNGRSRVLIGKDTRLSGYMLETALASGICSMGGDVMLVGPLPTPGIAYMTLSMRADAGAVISASHNPFEDNGIKLFSREGYKVPDEIEAQIEALIEDPSLLPPLATGGDIGRAQRIDDALGRYCVALKSQIPREMRFDGLRMVIDCGNGAAYKVAPMVFRELGANVITINCEPDGTNINKDCGALYPHHMARLVVETGADLGLALDGDGDRAILSDEKGQILDGDGILAIAALWLLKNGLLRGGGVVGTIMSNLGLEMTLGRHGLHLVRTDVGDRYVVEAMLRGGYNLGGEQSGHVIFHDHSTTGDGILTCLKIVEIMMKTGKSLSELSKVFERYPQVLVSAKVRKKTPFEELPHMAAAIESVKARLGTRGRLNVRYSGTSEAVRVMVEGEDEALIRCLAEEILAAAEADGILA